jgi:hypothetical protein
MSAAQTLPATKHAAEARTQAFASARIFQRLSIG